MIVAMTIFMAMQFCMPSFAIFSFWFYLVVTPLALKAVWRNNILFEIWRDWNGKLLLLLFGYIALHGLTQSHALQTLRHIITNAMFLLAVIVFHKDAKTEQFMRIMLIIVVICGIISLVSYFMSLPDDGRLIPIGQNNHSILGANIYALFAAAGLCLWRGANMRDKWLVAAAILLTMAIIVFSQSRGPLIAFCFTGAVGLLLLRYYKTLAVGAIFIALIIADMWLFYHGKQSILPLAPYYEYVLEALNRKSHRLEIWSLTWELIKQHPLNGYGLQASFPYGYAGVNPHNLFLATWYYTGVAGFVLLLATTISALKTLLKNRHQSLGFVGLLLLVHGVIACLTDQGQLVKTPSPLWFIFWWPVGIACFISMQQSSLAKSSQQQVM